MAYKLITDDKLLKFADLLIKENKLISVDTETESLYFRDRVVGFSISWKPGYAIYVPTGHKNFENCPLPIVQEFFQKIKVLRIVMHKSIFDRLFIYTSFGILLPIFADTMLYASQIGDPKGLKDLSLKHFSHKQTEFAELMREKFGHRWDSQGFNFSDTDPLDTDIMNYACEDADFTRRYLFISFPLAQKFNNIIKIEENVAPMTMKMNFTGAFIDRALLEPAIISFKESIHDLYVEICKVAGRDLKINSPVDLGNFLFDELKLPIIKRSQETGRPSADKEVLDELRGEHPVVDQIDQWRKLSRMLKAYVEKIPMGLDKNNRIFTHFDNLGAISGRFTSSGVEGKDKILRGLNLQNIPKQKKGRTIDMRSVFIAPEGFVVCKADYSQIEYRVMAALSKDTHMCESFRAGLDFHTATAAVMYGVEPSAVTKEMRDMGKVFNFGLSYGMTPKGLSMRFGCSEEEAELKIESYFLKLPGLVNLINACKARALKEGATFTFFGRKRILDLAGVPAKARDRLLRKAFNTRIQGTAADILKIAMLRVKERVLDKFKGDVELIMQVHDELVFYIRESKKDIILAEIQRAMDMPSPPDWVPILAQLGYGPNWSEDSLTAYVPPTDFQRDTWVSWAEVLPKDLSCSVSSFTVEAFSHLQ